MEALDHLGGLALGQRNFSTAERYFKRVVSLCPDLPKAHLNLGNLHNALGCFHAAEERYKKCLSLDSNYAIAYNNLGFVLNALGRFHEANQVVTRHVHEGRAAEFA